MMAKIFEDDRMYFPGDADLNVIGKKEKLAQWRRRKVGPAYYKLGRTIIYRGCDLNKWADVNRFEPSHKATG